MAYITGKIPQGCCMPSKYLGNDVYEVEPDVGVFHRYHKIYNDYHLFYAKIVGEKGEKLTVRLKWPQFDPEAVSQEYKEWSYYSANWISFFYVLPEVTYISTDQKHWSNIEGAYIDGDCIVFTIEMPEDECYISTTLYYTEAMFNDLLKVATASPYVQTECIGRGWDGNKLMAFTATDFTVPVSEKKAVYLQGAQHCHERTGCHVTDYMIRYLASGSDEVKEILKTTIFHFVPVVDITGWRCSCSVHPARTTTKMDYNYNRDWGAFTAPETKAIADWLQKKVDEGERFEFLADIHGGTGDERDYTSGAGVNIEATDSEEIKARKQHFVDMLAVNSDFIRPDENGCHPHTQEKGMFAIYAQEHFGTAFTFEVSQSKIWDRAAGRRFPNSQFAFKRFGEQLTRIVAEFANEEK